MKLIILALTLCINLFAWDFKYNELSENETNLTKTLIKIGQPYGLGLELASIGIVETRLGKFKSNNTYICGMHQINTNVAMKRLNSNGDAKQLCEEVRKNKNLSSILALKELIYWKKYSNNNLSSMIKSYNTGFKSSNYSKEYFRRFTIVYNELKKRSDLVNS